MWHYAIARMVVAARANGLRPIDGPFGDFSDPDGYRAGGEPRRGARLRRQMGDPSQSQVALANEVFSPSEAEVTQGAGASSRRWTRRRRTARARWRSTAA